MEINSMAWKAASAAASVPGPATATTPGPTTGQPDRAGDQRQLKRARDLEPLHLLDARLRECRPRSLLEFVG